MHDPEREAPDDPQTRDRRPVFDRFVLNHRGDRIRLSPLTDAAHRDAHGGTERDDRAPFPHTHPVLDQSDWNAVRDHLTADGYLDLASLATPGDRDDGDDADSADQSRDRDEADPHRRRRRP